MKTKLVALFAIAFMTISCLPAPPKPTKEEVVSKATKYAETFIDEITIDSCDYLIFSRYQMGGGLTHKGNCKNPIHTCK